MEADGVCQSYRGPKQRPCIEKSAAVGQIGANHDQCLYAQERGRVHERGEAERLHCCRDCSTGQPVASSIETEPSRQMLTVDIAPES